MKTKLETRVNQFIDTKNRPWVLKVTIGKIRKIRDTLGIDINDALDPTKTIIDNMANDPVLMFDVIYLCCEEQLAQKGVSLEDFSESISGDTIVGASSALVNAILDFFPGGKTEVIRESLALKEKMMKRIKKKAMKSLTNLTDQDLENAIDKMADQLGKQYITAPDS